MDLKEIALGSDDTTKIIKVAKAVGSSTRYQILQLLAKEELDISNLANKLGQTEANISAQVKALQNAELVECKYEPGLHGVRKICRTSVKSITIEIVGSRVEAPAEEE